MPRSLADPLFERLLRSFPADRAYTRTDWSDDAMPDPVAHFLGQLLDHHSRREARRLHRARTDWVNYDHPEMESAVRSFFEAVEAHTQVPAEEWKPTLRQASRHSTAHLVRPVYVLTNFVFGDQQEPLPLSEVLWRMNFFGPYAYLRDAVQTFAEKKDLDAFRADQFEQFLRHVDERVTSRFTPSQWLRLLDPFFETTRLALDRERIPVDLLKTFFADKNAPAIQQRLEQYEADGHEEVGSKVLYRLIEEAEAGPVPDEPESPPSPDERPSSDEPAAEPEARSDDDIWGVEGSARPEGSEAPTARESEGDTPLWKQFQQGDAPPASGDTGGTDDTADGQQPLWAQFRRSGDAETKGAASGDAAAESEPSSTKASATSPDADPAPAEDLEAVEREVLGTSNPPHRAVYVRQLFDGDETAYRRVLGRLGETESWGEASQIIAGDVFRTYKVNIYSDAAVHFTNAVESRFR